MAINLTEEFSRVLLWREAIEKGEFIKAPGYNLDYLSIKDKTISQGDIDYLCDAVNRWFNGLDKPYRVDSYNGMGEVFPTTDGE